ncbi:hypothetical protein KIL84_004467 [Mauremys mutica]|uniref:Decapping nuclease n=1 Tax=Mauremys mutica TaxID=74926 RepID=A0A9D3XPR7_9SAUR|nr:hypothetical protein KIL84_004467 [Mauremys mutica]
MEPSTRPAKRSSGAAEAPTEPGGSPKRGRWAPPTLPVEPALYDGPFPFYRRPAEEGRFSLDAQRRYHPDARQLRYFAPPPAERPEPPFDLRHGYRDCYVRRDEGRREGLEHLLQWVAGNRDRLRAQGDAAGRPVNADFVTWRGHLTKVLTTPYESQEGWLLAVSLFRGTLHKLIKWWAQSFLPGVSRIVAGFRAPDGSVAALETFETMKIFQLIRGDRGCWKPAVCMNFCEAFLAFLKSVVTEDDPQ